MKKLALALILLALSATPMALSAEESSPHSFSANVTMATDYVWRGISQTSENPAIQGGIDYAHASGLYAGTWASNIDFGGSIEIDWYAGFANNIAGLDYDVMVNYYSYPGADDDDAEINFVEFHVGLSYGLKLPLAPTIGVGYDYSPDFFGEDGSAHHYTGSLDLSLPAEFAMGATVGYQDVEGDKTSPDGFDYTWWKVGLSRDLFGFTLDLSYWDTNEEEMLGEDIASDRIVFSVSRSL